MNDFTTKHKHHLIAWIILLLITAVSGYVAFISKPLPSPNNGTIEQWNNSATSTQEHKNTRTQTGKNVYTSVDIFNNPEKTKDSAIQVAEKPIITATNTISATIEIDEHPAPQGMQGSSSSLWEQAKKYTIAYTNGGTVYDFMKALQDQGNVSFSGRDFGGGMGFFVEEINGVKNNQHDGKYWIYYANGTKSKLGVSNYIVKPQDVITWKYENEIH